MNKRERYEERKEWVSREARKRELADARDEFGNP
jgi:hypothetical protein